MKVNVMSDILKANDLLAQDIENLLRDKKTAGVTAGASTPDWIIKEFAQNLEALDDGIGPD